MSGAPGGYSGSSYGRGSGAAPAARTLEERAQAKEQMMASVRESSQQERRVYVGNLSYDVKWHHLKDFMRQCESLLRRLTTRFYRLLTQRCSWGGSICRCVITSEWNVEGGRQCVEMAGLSGLSLVVGRWIDGLGHCPRVM